MAKTCKCCTNRVFVEQRDNGEVDVVVMRDCDKNLVAIVNAESRLGGRLETRITMSKQDLVNMIGDLFMSRAELRRAIRNVKQAS